MCGIVAYIGQQEAYPIIIKGLKRLEYRGYDSAGIALLEDRDLKVYKTKGKVSELGKAACAKDKILSRSLRYGSYTLGNPRRTQCTITRTHTLSQSPAILAADSQWDY